MFDSFKTNNIDNNNNNNNNNNMEINNLSDKTVHFKTTK